MQAGAFNQRVTVYRPVLTRDDQGGFVAGTPTELLTRAAAVVAGSDGSESLRAGQRVAEGQYRVTLRYNSVSASIVPKDYLTWHNTSKSLEILSVRPDGPMLRETVVLTCVERTS